MKKFTIVILLVSVCLLCLGAVARERLQFKAAGFSIEPLEVLPGSGVYRPLTMLLPPTDGFAPNVIVQIQPYAGPIGEYVTISKKQFAANNFDVIRETRVGKESFILEYTGKIKGRKLHWYAKGTSTGKFVYLTTATATETQWPRVAAQLRQCVNSFGIGTAQTRNLERE